MSTQYAKLRDREGRTIFVEASQIGDCIAFEFKAGRLFSLDQDASLALVTGLKLAFHHNGWEWSGDNEAAFSGPPFDE